MDLSEVQAVIDSAKARGSEPLERFVREQLPDASDREVADAVEVATEIIEAVPIFLARARQEAEARNLSMVVDPLLEQARGYFLHPVDLIPEMTQGLAGLLDDTYLVLRILQNLQSGPDPLLDWDLDYPAMFLRRLVGPVIGDKLDRLSIEALQNVSESVNALWNRMSAEA